MHQHHDSCSCGETHSDCGEVHHHHGENCGCGHTHETAVSPDGLSLLQMEFLFELRQRYLPIASFSVVKTGDPTQRAAALSPVYIGAPDDTMEHVKQMGAALAELEAFDLLTLDYDMPLKDYAYDEYKTSALYAYFVQTVKEAAGLANASFDTPLLELGSMALTDAGEALVDSIAAASLETKPVKEH